jgi:predicted AlkP superfamily pyrophosphatase or phosphodiesterase
MPRNVILLVLDTVRKDYFDEYASQIQSLSDVSFSQCRTASSCSVPSHASILTGELPHEHGQHSTNVDYTQILQRTRFFLNYQTIQHTALARTHSPVRRSDSIHISTISLKCRGPSDSPRGSIFVSTKTKQRQTAFSSTLTF